MKAILARLSRMSFFRFAFVGGCGYVLAVILLAVFTGPLGIEFAAANGLTIALTIIATWLGNRYLTFRASRARSLSGILQEALKFIGANGLGAAINYGTALALVRLAAPPFNNHFLAQACGVLMGMVSNFLLSKKLVFRGP